MRKTIRIDMIICVLIHLALSHVASDYALSHVAACLNMVVNHFMHVCPHLQPDTRQQLTSLKHNVSVQVGAGKQYSAHSARSLGVYEAFGRLFFEDEALKQPEA